MLTFPRIAVAALLTGCAPKWLPPASLQLEVPVDLDEDAVANVGKAQPVGRQVLESWTCDDDRIQVSMSGTMLAFEAPLTAADVGATAHCQVDLDKSPETSVAISVVQVP